jgi:hypothetical protein
MGITDENDDPIEDWAVPFDEDSSYLANPANPQMAPLELKWWKNGAAPLRGKVRFDGDGISYMNAAGNVVYGNVLIWRYVDQDPKNPKPNEWKPLLLLNTGDINDTEKNNCFVDIPQNVPTGVPPFLVEGLKSGTIEIKAKVLPTGVPKENGLLTDSANVMVVAVDLDVDSDNTAVVEGTRDEDSIEKNSPGKFMLVNKADANTNGIPDYAERCVGADPRIVPVVVTIPDRFQLGDMTLSFLYSAAEESLQATGTDEPPIGNPLRLWKRNDNGTATYIPYNGSYEGIRLADLGFSQIQRTVTLYLEAVSLPTTGSKSESQLGVVLHINSLNKNFTDTIKVTICDLDLLADINRDGDIDTNDNNGDETSKGMRVPLNADDDDHNGTPDKNQVEFPDNDDENDVLVRDEDDELIPVIVNICPEKLPKTAGLEDATVTLEASGADKIHLWTDRRKTRQLVLPYQWQDLDPKTIYVEGISASNTVRDICLKIVYRHGAIQTEVDKINISASRAVRIPIEYCDVAKGVNIIQGIAGIIYVPTDGFLSVSSLDSSSIKLYYIGNSELDFDEVNALICGQQDSSIVAEHSPYCNYDVPSGKQGWYYVRLMGNGFMNVKATFVQEGRATKTPWNGPYWPKADTSIEGDDIVDLWNLYDDDGPLEKYDHVYGTMTKRLEEDNYYKDFDAIPWEGHCNGWAVASILIAEPANETFTIPALVRAHGTFPSTSVDFTQDDIKGLYSELFTGASFIISEELEGQSESGTCLLMRSIDDDCEILSFDAHVNALNLAADDVQNAIKVIRTKKEPLCANLRASIKEEWRTPRPLETMQQRNNIVNIEDQVWNHAVYYYKSEFSENMSHEMESIFEVKTKIRSNDDCGKPYREDTYIYEFQYSQGIIVPNSKYQKWKYFSNLAPESFGTASATVISQLGGHCFIDLTKIQWLYTLRFGIDPELHRPE